MSDYRRQVFVNCPFDRRYQPLFRGIVFTVISCDLVPRCSLERIGGHTRLDLILLLIRECKYGVHDLSRIGLSGGVPRFNMPFELGIFLGAQRIADGEQAQKVSLVLERERYRYRQFISDLSGADVVPHADRVKDVVKAVRDWLAADLNAASLPSGRKITGQFEGFHRDFKAAKKKAQEDHRDVSFGDLKKEIVDWINLSRVGTGSLIA